MLILRSDIWKFTTMPASATVCVPKTHHFEFVSHQQQFILRHLPFLALASDWTRGHWRLLMYICFYFLDSDRSRVCVISESRNSFSFHSFASSCVDFLGVKMHPNLCFFCEWMRVYYKANNVMIDIFQYWPTTLHSKNGSYRPKTKPLWLFFNHFLFSRLLKTLVCNVKQKPRFFK